MVVAINLLYLVKNARRRHGIVANCYILNILENEKIHKNCHTNREVAREVLKIVHTNVEFSKKM